MWPAGGAEKLLIDPIFFEFRCFRADLRPKTKMAETAINIVIFGVNEFRGTKGIRTGPT